VTRTFIVKESHIMIVFFYKYHLINCGDVVLVAKTKWWSWYRLSFVRPIVFGVSMHARENLMGQDI